jgi:G3E family GTPase
LVATLENLIEKRINLDYILIEASGMANPGPIASLFWLDEALESRLRLDGVVTLVDAYNVQRQLKDTEEAALQIAYADRILLNKVDLINDDQKQAAVDSIRAIHPTVPIRLTTHAQVPDLDWILDANCYDAERAKEVDRVLSQVKEEEFYSCSRPNCSSCAEEKPLHTHSHTSAVGTVALVQNGSVDFSRMNKWLASILWPNQDEPDKVLRARLEQESVAISSPSLEMQIFRIKGILSVSHTDLNADDEPYLDQDGLDSRRYIVQAVHDLWEIHPASDDLQWDRPLDGQDELPVRSCKLIFIGRFLKAEDLRTGFESCFLDSNK